MASSESSLAPAPPSRRASRVHPRITFRDLPQHAAPPACRPAPAPSPRQRAQRLPRRHAHLVERLQQGAGLASRFERRRLVAEAVQIVDDLPAQTQQRRRRGLAPVEVVDVQFRQQTTHLRRIGAGTGASRLFRNAATSSPPAPSRRTARCPAAASADARSCHNDSSPVRGGGATAGGGRSHT